MARTLLNSSDKIRFPCTYRGKSYFLGNLSEHNKHGLTGTERAIIYPNQITNSRAIQSDFHGVIVAKDEVRII